MSTPARAKTLVYSTVDGHNLHLDYWLPGNTTDGTLPAVVYYHGGGMSAGSRRDVSLIAPWMLKGCQEKGFIFIAADYRLVHPCTALDQIDDAKALLKFLAGDFNKSLPPGVSLDPRRIAVTGFSAGTYSARAACVYASPKPAAFMSAYGLGGDMLLDHWVTPRPPTSFGKGMDMSSVPDLLADTSVISDNSQRRGPVARRFALTVRWELDGTMLDNLFAHPGLGAKLRAVGREQREDALPHELKPGFVQSFVTKDYPPSFFVHGTEDEVVSPEESIYHYKQLQKLGVKSELLLLENAGHCLAKPGSVKIPLDLVPEAEAAYRRSFEFIVEAFKAVA